MNKATFLDLLIRISKVNRDFATKYVVNPLPDSFRYFVRLNQSADENPLKENERIFPDDSSGPTGMFSAFQVVDLLWRDGFVPEWVDISVCQSDWEYTYFNLLCCGRFTNDDSMLYYAKTGQGPFGCKSPTFPPNWTEQQVRFDLNWKSKG